MRATSSCVRGFTLIEVLLVVSITSLLLPIVYSFHRTWNEHGRRATWQIGAAEATRRLSDSVRLDLRTHDLVGEDGLVLEGSFCETIRYLVLETGDLVREAGESCGGTTVVARHVERLHRDGGLIEITFYRRLRVDLMHRVVTRVGVVP